MKEIIFPVIATHYPADINADEETFLKALVRNAEADYISYKQMIEVIGRNRDVFDPTNEDIVWLKAHLRDMKNMREHDLSKYRQDLTNIRQGLNPEYMYNSWRK